MECDPFDYMDVLGLNSLDKDLMCFDNHYKFLIRDCMWSGEDNDVVEDLINYDKCSFDYSLRIKGLSDIVDDTDGLEWNHSSLPATISSPLSSDNSNSSTDATLSTSTPTSFTHQLKASNNSSNSNTNSASQQFAAAASLLRNGNQNINSSNNCRRNSSNHSTSNTCGSSSSLPSKNNNSPTKSCSSKSLYPQRRNEHNKSEKKRRDHLRNAFNSLKDQIPKLKNSEKKVARVAILKEATSYVTLLTDKHQYLEKTRKAELVKKEQLLKKLKLLQQATGQECAL